MDFEEGTCRGEAKPQVYMEKKCTVALKEGLFNFCASVNINNINIDMISLSSFHHLISINLSRNFFFVPERNFIGCIKHFLQFMT